MDILEFFIWGCITLILMRLNEKPIYDWIQDLKFEYNKFVGKEENIDDYVAINYME
jgi:hypothetical protein